MKFKLNYKDIDFIKKNSRFSFSQHGGDVMNMFSAIQIKHHNPDVPQHIYINSPKESKNSLLKAIKKTSQNKAKVLKK